jgi:hypothetical protein
MTEILETRKCLDLGVWRTLSIMLEYTDTTTKAEESIDLSWNIQLTYDRIIQPNNL